VIGRNESSDVVIVVMNGVGRVRVGDGWLIMNYERSTRNDTEVYIKAKVYARWATVCEKGESAFLIRFDQSSWRWKRIESCSLGPR
jgi:hypothetical protein